MKYIIPLLLLAGSAFGQNAVYTSFSSTVKGMTVGTNYCYFWFHNSVNPSIFAQGWDYEVACYSGSNNVVLHFKKATVTTDEGYTFTGGYIRFIISPNMSDPTKYDIQIGARGTSDGADVSVTDTI